MLSFVPSSSTPSGLAHWRSPGGAEAFGGGRSPWVFLHGLFRQGSDAAPLWPAVAQRHPILAVDHVGHGASVRLDSYRVVDHLPRLAMFLREETGVTPAVLYGHSMGAMLAAALAAAHPERVRAIVLEDPPFHTMGARLEGSLLHRYFQAIQPAIGDSTLTAARLGAFRVPVSATSTAPLSEVREAAQIRYMVRCFAQADPRLVEPVVSGHWLDGYDVEAVWRGVRCPTLLLQSDPGAGGMLTDEDTAMAVRLGADVTAVRLPPGVGHQAHWQDTATVVRHMLAFLESVA